MQNAKKAPNIGAFCAIFCTLNLVIFNYHYFGIARYEVQSKSHYHV